MKSCLPGGAWSWLGPPGQDHSCVISRTPEADAPRRGAFFERPVIRFLSPPRVGQAEGEPFSEKPLIKGFTILGVLGLSCQAHWSRKCNLVVMLRTLRGLALRPLPLLPCPVPLGLRATSLQVPSIHGNWNSYSLRFLDLFGAIRRYTRLSGTLVERSIDEANTPFGADLGEGAI